MAIFLWVILLALFTGKTYTQCPNASFFTDEIFGIPQRTRNEPDAFDYRYPSPGAPEADTVIAFIGDQALTSSAQSVLNMIQEEGAHAVFHAGDFDYRSNPGRWEDQINSILGQGFPYYASIGNHDYDALEGTNGYQQVIFDRLQRIGAECIGSVGVSMFCNVRGITLFLFGGTNFPSPARVLADDFVSVVQQGFEQFGSSWRVCMWHWNQRSYQLGGKGDDMGWAILEACRQAGAIISNGHEHSYARTHLMSNFQNQTIVDTNSNLQISPGQSLLWVSGVGGQGVRECQNDAEQNPWWGSALCSSSNPPLLYGAMFCRFNPGGASPNSANCWFRQINGDLRDQFSLTTTVPQSTCCQPAATATCGNINGPGQPRACGISVNTECLSLECSCSLGETCENQVCVCDQASCEAQGRTCSSLGCVFPNQTATSQQKSNRNFVIGIVVTVLVVVGLISCVCIVLVIYRSQAKKGKDVPDVFVGISHDYNDTDL